MKQGIKVKLKRAIELQKKVGKKLFYPEVGQWLDEEVLLYGTEGENADVASLIGEIESSAKGFKESVFYLVAKQLSDCRKILECKIEQKMGPKDDWHVALGHAQEIWPSESYIQGERAVKMAFEELYPVEHLSTLFRMGIDLMDDSNLVFKDCEDVALIQESISYQMKRTKEMLEKNGYVFFLPDTRENIGISERIIVLAER